MSRDHPCCFGGFWVKSVQIFAIRGYFPPWNLILKVSTLLGHMPFWSRWLFHDQSLG
jgi:hypothetical protein